MDEKNGQVKKEAKLPRSFSFVLGRGFGILILFALLLGIFNLFAVNTTTNTYTAILDNEGTILELANQIKIDLLQARRAENEVIFLAQVDKIVIVDALVANIIENTNLIQELSTSELFINKLKDIQMNIVEYGILFNSVAKKLINRGGGWFDPMNGTVGATWIAIDAAEAIIVNFHNNNILNDTIFFQMQSLTYQIRANSSMIMMTRRTVNINQTNWINTVSLLIQEIKDLANSNLNSTAVSELNDDLDNYQTAFDVMVAVDIAIKEETALFEEAISDVGAGIDDMVLEVNLAVTIIYQQAAEEVFVFQLLAIGGLLIVAIIGIGLTYYLSRSFSTPVKNLETQVFEIIQDVNEIADGNFNKRIEIETTNELKILEQSLNSMVGLLVKNIQQRQQSEEKLTQSNLHLDRLVKSLKVSEEKYRTLFEDSPIPLWEENWVEVKKYINKLKNKNISSLTQFFEDNPEAIVNIAGMIKLESINQATLALFNVKSKEDFYKDMSQIFTVL